MKVRYINIIVGILAVFVLVSVIFVTFLKPESKFYFKIILFSFLPIVGIFAVTNFMIKQGDSNRNVIIWIVRFALIIISYVYIGNSVYKMILDIPNAVSANYSMVIGEPSNVLVEKNGKVTEETFMVKDIVFKVDYYDFEEFEKSKNYEITYLPISKYVISIRTAIN